MKRKFMAIIIFILVIIAFFYFIAYSSSLRTPEWANRHPLPNPMLKK